MNTPEHIKLVEENHQLKAELERLRLFYNELETTNNHLISATWRERDMKKKLRDTLDELHATQQVVEMQNRRISESINYARKIQHAINASVADLQAVNPSSFIVYQPKDVISGDFPWLYRNNQFSYVAAVDCTGHGVPGAMMSMIGNLLLNDIVNDEQELMPSEILNRLHSAVVNTLKQHTTHSNSNDGMDIALIRINNTTGELVFAGAHRPLLIYRDQVPEPEIIAADKFPIGGMHYRGKNFFSDHRLQMHRGDRIYMFTDGMPDQIGGPDKRKLMSRGMREHFSSQAGKPMHDVQAATEALFLAWKGDFKQIDDILVIGMEF